MRPDPVAGGPPGVGGLSLRGGGLAGRLPDPRRHGRSAGGGAGVLGQGPLRQARGRADRGHRRPRGGGGARQGDRRGEDSRLPTRRMDLRRWPTLDRACSRRLLPRVDRGAAPGRPHPPDRVARPRAGSFRGGLSPRHLRGRRRRLPRSPGEVDRGKPVLRGAVRPRSCRSDQRGLVPVPDAPALPAYPADLEAALRHRDRQRDAGRGRTADCPIRGGDQALGPWGRVLPAAAGRRGWPGVRDGQAALDAPGGTGGRRAVVEPRRRSRSARRPVDAQAAHRRASPAVERAAWRHDAGRPAAGAAGARLGARAPLSPLRAPQPGEARHHRLGPGALRLRGDEGRLRLEALSRPLLLEAPLAAR